MEDNLGFRITLKTNNIWRVNQLTEALNSLDGLVTRISVAGKISETCQKFDYAISNLQAFGLLEKGQKWIEAQTPDEIITRNDFVDLFTSFRNAGVEVSSKEFGLKFTFTVSDLMDIAPLSSRPEIEKINISSPGEIILLVSSGILISKQAINLIIKIGRASCRERV